MKQIYVLAAALMLTAVTANAQQNLITNGDFENWTAENPVNFDEKLIGTVTYNDLITKETTTVQAGNAVKQESKVQGTTQYLEYGNLVPVVAGHNYTISYWYMDNDTKANTRLWSTWLNDNTVATGDQTNIQESEFSTESAQWVHKILTVTAPVGATKLRYQVRTYSQNNTSGGFIYYDNLSLVDNGVAGLNDNTIEGLQIFPNPLTDNILNITTANNADMDVVIYDMVGKQVVNTKVVNGTVDTANLTAGLYIVKVTEEGKTATKKLIKK